VSAFWTYSAMFGLGGGGLSVSQSVLHRFLSSNACLQSTIVPFEGSEETRGARVRALEIFRFSLVWWAGTPGRSILHHFLSSKARLQSTIV
jgi:hypothetical protein